MNPLPSYFRLFLSHNAYVSVFLVSSSTASLINSIRAGWFVLRRRGSVRDWRTNRAVKYLCEAGVPDHYVFQKNLSLLLDIREKHTPSLIFVSHPYKLLYFTANKKTLRLSHLVSNIHSVQDHCDCLLHMEITVQLRIDKALGVHKEALMAMTDFKQANDVLLTLINPKGNP